MKKRILMLLSVVALMVVMMVVTVVMMVVTVAPAFAARPASHPTPSNFHASHNPSGDASNCATDPVCVGDIQVGQSHHESFPQGQEKFQSGQ
jgi:hypothetical protein